MPKLTFEDRVIVVTGAGNGLGRAHARELARRGARVVVNDIGKLSSPDGKEVSTADNVVREIVSSGGEAVANYDSVIEGDKVIQTALDTWGKIDVLVNNAGIANACPFNQMKPEAWKNILDVHLQGSFACTRAAWPHMEGRKYGRIIFTTSPVGIHGWKHFSHYGTAKAGIIGLATTLSVEGAKNNIFINSVAPFALTGMTGATTTEHQDSSKVRPGYVAQLVAWLAHESTTENGSVFEAGGGIIHKVRWALSQALRLDGDDCTAERIADDIASSFSILNDFNKPVFVSAGDSNFIGKELLGSNFLELFGKH